MGTMGKSIVPTTPCLLKQSQIDMANFLFRKWYSRDTEWKVNIHATYARTKPPFGCKMGQGRGNIHHYVGICQAGKPAFTLPQITPFHGEVSNLTVLKRIGDR